jgi:catechol 2,3-dioxygenase-like lactoylglutathione lyase family enzyme
MDVSLNTTLTVGLRHAGLVVSDIFASLSFYSAFGFEPESKPASERGEYIEKALDLQGVVVTTVKMNYVQQRELPHANNALRLELVQFEHPIANGLVLGSYLPIIARMHLCFSVLSLSETVSQIVRLGGHPPQQHTPEMNMVFAFDPDWHPLELIAYQ